ncbi:hypothetical protein C5469_17145 [Photorhabdus cinerea]|uniref:Uncharacterized protein n=1 Tax=Photorhabdus cinerea TaxID=471575 RepID=A0A7X5QGB1_9GAMM|nr:hypothetical protein [Photorhabdus cinerea]
MTALTRPNWLLQHPRIGPRFTAIFTKSVQCDPHKGICRDKLALLSQTANDADFRAEFLFNKKTSKQFSCTKPVYKRGDSHGFHLFGIK